MYNHFVSKKKRVGRWLIRQLISRLGKNMWLSNDWPSVVTNIVILPVIYHNKINVIVHTITIHSNSIVVKIFCAVLHDVILSRRNQQSDFAWFYNIRTQNNLFDWQPKVLQHATNTTRKSLQRSHKNHTTKTQTSKIHNNPATQLYHTTYSSTNKHVQPTTTKKGTSRRR